MGRSDLILETGTPVLIAGFTEEQARADIPFADAVVFAAKAFCGRLDEPHRWYDHEFHSFIVNGPYAESISPRGVIRKTIGVTGDESAAVVILDREMPDARDCVMYAVVEDVRGLVHRWEQAVPSVWGWIRAEILREVADALRERSPAVADPFRD